MVTPNRCHVVPIGIVDLAMHHKCYIIEYLILEWIDCTLDPAQACDAQRFTLLQPTNGVGLWMGHGRQVESFHYIYCNQILLTSIVNDEDPHL